MDYYSKNVIQKQLLDDPGLVKIKNVLEDKENEPVLHGGELPAELETILNNVAASYRSLYWEQQNRNNRLWISLVQPLVGKYGDVLAPELGKLYLEMWVWRNEEKPLSCPH
jgi:hypothetical protein